MQTIFFLRSVENVPKTKSILIVTWFPAWSTPEFVAWVPSSENKHRSSRHEGGKPQAQEEAFALFPCFTTNYQRYLPVLHHNFPSKLATACHYLQRWTQCKLVQAPWWQAQIFKVHVVHKGDGPGEWSPLRSLQTQCPLHNHSATQWLQKTQLTVQF